jgi:hypothetical protein
MGAVDKCRFEKKGGHGCSNSFYLLDRTTCCGRFRVEDGELHDLYFDPTDLDRRIILRDSPQLCPFCRASEWDLIEVDDLNEVPVEWQWACHTQ